MDIERKVLTVAEVAKILGISTNLAYRLVRAGEIYAIKCGDRYVIPKQPFELMLSGKH
jgi:excisionase family DNA binding protein